MCGMVPKREAAPGFVSVPAFTLEEYLSAVGLSGGSDGGGAVPVGRVRWCSTRVIRCLAAYDMNSCGRWSAGE